MKVFILAATICLSGCGIHPIPFDYAGNLPDHIVIDSDVPGTLARIHYLGVGGFAIEVAGHRAMTAPFYTHLPWWRVFLPASEDKTRIQEKFPAELHDRASGPNVEVIVAAHAHYDHLMDVPYLMAHQLKSAKLFGSGTAITQVNMKLGLDCDDNSRVRRAEPNRWAWINKNLRIYTLKSSHAYHFLGITLMKGTRNCQRKPRLLTPSGWKMGEPYAYIIDFVDDKKNILFRVFHQDAASSDKTVTIPKELLEEKKIDLATIVLAGYENAERYPQAIIEETNARLYLVGHWESFFSQREVPILTPLSSLTEFVDRLAPAARKVGANWLFLKPGTPIVVETK